MHILDMNRTYFYFGPTLKCFKWTVADFSEVKILSMNCFQLCLKLALKQTIEAIL